MDFTLKKYKRLIMTLRDQGFCLISFEQSLSKFPDHSIILRHDVDKSPENSLVFAAIESDMGISGTYYFRCVPASWNEKIIRQIAGMGHEIGYHYEDLSATAQRRKGATTEKELVELAIERFKENLEKLRGIVPVKTICMHGSPMSRWDSRLLWKYYDYHDFGIIGEPYFDMNFDEMLYLTDTGRRWDGDPVNVRDKSINHKEHKEIAKDAKKEVPHSHSLAPSSSLKFHSTFDIIRAADYGELPDKIMMTFHPQRWTDKKIPWAKELIWQNMKNIGKYFVIKMKD
jgi:hypothetical protein